MWKWNLESHSIYNIFKSRMFRNTFNKIHATLERWKLINVDEKKLKKTEINLDINSVFINWKLNIVKMGIHHTHTYTQDTHMTHTLMHVKLMNKEG